MPCTNHPDIIAGVRACARCAQPFCESCLVSLGGQPSCARCKDERLRDLASGVAPAGVLDLASVWARFGALLLDGLILGVPLGIVLVVVIVMFAGAGAFEGTAEPDPAVMIPVIIVFVLAVIAIPLVYEALMLGKYGATLGKKALGLRVVTPEGNPISRGQAWGRAGMRIVISNIPYVGAFINYLPACFTAEKTCVHDMAAKTRVIRG